METPEYGPEGLCRVRILVAGLRFEFRATTAQARDVTDALRRWSSGVRILIDDQLRPDLPALPCAQLWGIGFR